LTFEPVRGSQDLADLALIVLGGLVAHQLECVLPFDERLALSDLALTFDRTHLGAVLLLLRALFAPARGRPVRGRSARRRGGRCWRSTSDAAAAPAQRNSILRFLSSSQIEKKQRNYTQS
jgi:hypothetical protein